MRALTSGGMPQPVSCMFMQMNSPVAFGVALSISASKATTRLRNDQLAAFGMASRALTRDHQHCSIIPRRLDVGRLNIVALAIGPSSPMMRSILAMLAITSSSRAS